MYNNSFTYTISSRDNTLGEDMADNVKIKCAGFPQEYKYFYCKVLNFTINYGSLTTAWRPISYVMLVCNNLGVQNITTGNRISQVIATANLVDGTMRNENGKFVINNPNNHTLTFNLVDESFNLTTLVINQNTADTVWTLTLEITPIEQTPNNYQLQNGL